MDWIKLCSADSPQCLEIKRGDGVVFLRNTDAPGSVVELTDAEWSAATKHIRENDSI